MDNGYGESSNGWVIVGAFLLIVACVVGLIWVNGAVPDESTDPLAYARMTEQARRDRITQTSQALAQQAMRVEGDQATATQEMQATINAFQSAQQLQQTQAMQTQAAGQATEAAQRITQSAADTATAQAWQITQAALAMEHDRATATALFGASQATGTAIVQAWQTTATVEFAELQKTVQVENMKSAAAAAQAVQTQTALDIQRSQETNPVRAWGWIVVGVPVVVLMTWLAWRFGQAQAHQGQVIRDAAGDVVGFVEQRGRKTNWVAPGRMIGAGISSTAAGIVEVAIEHPEIQERVTTQDNAVRAIKASSGDTQAMSRALGGGQAAQQKRPYVVVSGPEQLPAPLRDADVINAIDSDWSDANDNSDE